MNHIGRGKQGLGGDGSVFSEGGRLGQEPRGSPIQICKSEAESYLNSQVEVHVTISANTMHKL